MSNHPSTLDGGFAARAAELAARRAEKTARLERLWRMTAAERVVAYRRGELCLPECLAWARHSPDEIPLIDGEFAFIMVKIPEYAERTIRERLAAADLVSAWERRTKRSRS